MLDLFWGYALFGLAVIPFTIYFNQILFFIFAFYVSIRKFYKRNNEPLEYLPGVSIVKTLTGVDPLLSENIISHMELRYPNFEIIFCVEDPNDPAIELVESLFRKYPNVDARLIIGGKGNIINPLVNNFVPGYEAAKFDFIWFSSSRIKVSTDIMIDLVRKLEDPNVALVHQIPFVCDQRGFMNAIEKICFGCALGRSAIALNHMGMLCFTGMSYILRKSILDKFGGIARFGKFLAEDYFFSKELFENGYEIALSAYPAQQNVANVTMNIYVSRMVRWLRLRLNMLTIVACLLEPMIECVNLGFLMALSLNYLFGFYILTTMAVHIVVWMTLDYFLLRCVQGGPLPFSVLKFIFAWWARELITYWVYVKAVLHPRTVKWGKNTYYLSLGGHTELLRGPNGTNSTKNSGIAGSSNGAVGATPKRTKSIEHVSLLANEVTPTVSQVKLAAPPKTSAGIATATNLGASDGTWRHFAQNGYVRGSLDHQHVALISDA
ncbi:hypothetical protein Aperf_G00000026436 [Anoplocephala perfoliata]